MKLLKGFLCAILCIALLITLAACLWNFRTRSLAGRDTSATAITVTDEAWIWEQFGNCRTTLSLMTSVDAYAAEHFSYDYEKADSLQLLQHFDFQDLITTNKGVCYDFACFFKACCMVWSKRTGIPLEVYVISAMPDDGDVGHAWNVAYLSDGTCVDADLTVSVCRAAKGMPRWGIHLVIDPDIPTYVQNCHYQLKNLY